MHNNILLFNLPDLKNAKFKPLLKKVDYDWESLFEISRIQGVTGFYPRTGQHCMPWRTTVNSVPGVTFPDHTKPFDKSFTEVSDAAARNLMSATKPLLIFWSGGIDSTVIVAAILKNFSAEQLKNVTVACTRISIYENPYFYKNFIVPNVKVVDTDLQSVDPDLLKHYTTVNGELGDLLYGGCNGSFTQNGNWSQWWRLGQDYQTLAPLYTELYGAKCADVYMKWVTENAESAGIEINTVSDFVWWSQFNFHWGNIRFRETMGNAVSMDAYPYVRNISMQDYLDNVVFWYDSADYQLWSIHNNKFGEKYTDNLGGYKLASKRYIYDITGDKFWFQQARKNNSVYRTETTIGKFAIRRQQSPDDHTFCILEDLTVLNLEKDTDRILELLPYHIGL